TLVDKSPGEEAGHVLHRVEGQVILPGGEWLVAHQRGNPGDCGWLPDHEFRLLLQASSGEEDLPIEARRLLFEVCPRPVIVPLEHVLRIDPAGVDLGDLSLQLEDPSRLSLSLRNPAEA